MPYYSFSITFFSGIHSNLCEIVSVLYEQTLFAILVDGLKAPELNHGRAGSRIAPAVFTTSCFLPHSQLEKKQRENARRVDLLLLLV